MSQAIPTQHPAVVLRSHFQQVRALLAVAMIAVVGLTSAVVILANDSDEAAQTSAAAPIVAVAPQEPGIRYDGGPDEGTRGALAESSVPVAPGTRYDGGPEEGSRGALQSQAPASRYDGGPEEGTRGPGH